MIRIVGDRESLENALNGSGGKAVPALAVLYGNGAPDTIRTCDLCLRRDAKSSLLEG
jgi:hypothetical protein